MGKKSKILAQNFQVKAIVRTLKEVQESKRQILAWKIFGNIKVTANVKLKVVRSHRNELLFEISDENFKHLTKITTGQEKVNFYVPNGNILFQCKIKEISEENNNMVVFLPDRVVRQERRKSLRIRTDNKNVDISFQKEIASSNSFNQYFSKSCYDISTGGVSFILTPTESKLFALGDKIYFVDLMMNGNKVDVDLELVNIIPVDPDPHNKLAYRGFKACFKFARITDEAINIIDIFVMSNIELDESA